MSAKMPFVSLVSVGDHAGYLYEGEVRLRLDTPAWFAWLEAAPTTRFAYPLFDPAKGYIVGRMTVRKERRPRGGTYWSAYRRRDGHLHKVYLGMAAALTLARLEEAAQSLYHGNGRTDYAADEGTARENDARR